MADQEEELYRLNKFLAHGGICSRRQAAELVKSGKVKVNGAVERNPAIQVSKKDVVEYQDKQVTIVENKVYLLLNKPKNTLTTVKDDRGRKTVIDLIKHKISERVYPIGRLDRNTTGLLLLTNDGDLAKKLSHPSYEVKKIYQVHLNESLSKSDLEKIQGGLTLEDGFIKPDAVSYAQGLTKKDIGIELHSGKNRIIRRIFEHLNYEVIKLDRVYYAGLTKKDLPRSRFRHLTKQELIMLRHFQ